MDRKKVALITGASQGIGRAIAVKFAKEGLQLAITARNQANLQKTARMIQKVGDTEPFIIPADLRQPEQVVQVAHNAISNLGKVDVLVNNAGVMYLKPFLELSLEEYEQMMQVNMRAVFILTQEIIRHMISRGEGGTIINIASLAGKNGFKTGTGYAATKWALRGFAQCLMEEVREYDIRVITIFPGSVNTTLGCNSQVSTETLPQNKIQPEEIADAAYWAFSMPLRTMVSEIDMRPSNPKKM